MTNVGPADYLSADFAQRLNLVTGDNGLGKSFLLDVAWWALTRRWPHEVNPRLSSGYAAKPRKRSRKATIEFDISTKSRGNLNYTSTYMPRDQAWLGRAGRPWNPGLVLYAHADGGFSIWDPARNYWKKQGDVDIQERLPAYVFSQNDVWDGLTVEVGGKPSIVCNGLLRDWASWIRADGLDARRMRTALNHLSPTSNTPDRLAVGPLVRLDVNDARDIPSLNTAYARDIPILHASSGVRRVTALAYMLVWAWNEHVRAVKLLGEKRAKQVVILIDEVESHLHPKWQRSILKAVMNLSKLMHKNAELQLIAATHSPMVLASAEALFDPLTDAWLDIDLVEIKDSSGNFGMQPIIQRRDFVRQGDASSWLTSEAFNMKTSRSIEAEQVLEKAAIALSDSTFSESEAQKLDSELRSVLGETDPFWIRWRYVAEKRNWISPAPQVRTSIQSPRRRRT